AIWRDRIGHRALRGDVCTQLTVDIHFVAHALPRPHHVVPVTGHEIEGLGIDIGPGIVRIPKAYIDFAQQRFGCVVGVRSIWMVKCLYIRRSALNTEQDRVTIVERIQSYPKSYRAAARIDRCRTYDKSVSIASRRPFADAHTLQDLAVGIESDTLVVDA